MFNGGVKGSNFKLTSKPPLAPKSKHVNISACKPSENRINSPYISQQGPRRAQSATNLHGVGNTTSNNKPISVSRKNSEPNLSQKFSGSLISTVKSKVTSQINQRSRQGSGDSERSSGFCSRSTGSSSTPQKLTKKVSHPSVLRVAAIYKNKQTIPKFLNNRSKSATSSRQNSSQQNDSSSCEGSVVNNSHDSVIQMMLLMGDQDIDTFQELDQELTLEDLEDFKNEHNFDFSGGGDGINKEKLEYTENIDNTGNYNSGTSCSNSEVPCGTDELTDEGESCRNSGSENEDHEYQQQEETGSNNEQDVDEELREANRNFDQILLNQSDTLIQDVVDMCNEIGITSNLVEILQNPNNFDLPTRDDNLEDLSLVPSKPLDSQRNSHQKMSSTTSTDEDFHQRSETAKPTISTNGKKNSRPPSAASILSRHSSNGDANEAYSKILETLKLIEEEEKKGSPAAAQLGEILRNSCKSPQYTSCTQTTLPNIVVDEPKPSTSTQQRQQQFDSIISPRLPSTCPSVVRQQSDCLCLSARSAASTHQFSSRSQKVFSQRPPPDNISENRPKSAIDTLWETADDTTKRIFSFLDEVEKTDKETLFTLQFQKSPTRRGVIESDRYQINTGERNSDLPLQTMDTLIRKGSVELAREIILLERKLDETIYSVNVLEETLINQRELNVRNLKNAEKDMKKRLKVQQEEFELALTRHQTFVDQLIAEKRTLQDKCEKVLKESKETERKLQEQIKSLQEKHLEELRRIRKIQQNSENTRKQKWVGSKTQEIREMTVKGLEPEVQRIVQRHQQEMNEMRAWHSDELRELEERCHRKGHMQLQELREKLIIEMEDACRKERELIAKRMESELKQQQEDFEAQRRRLANELSEERERFAVEEMKLKDLLQENNRKAQIKGEVEIENLKQEHEQKINNLERKHENELRSLKDVYEAQKDNWMSTYVKKHEQTLFEREEELIQKLQQEKDKEMKEKEKKLKEEFQKLRAEEELATESRIKRMQEKLLAELEDVEKSEREIKSKFTALKSQLLAKEEEIFSLKTTLQLKEKQNSELQESNMKMMEERVNLTSVIRREFASQIQELDETSRTLKAHIVELQTKHKLEYESYQLEIEKNRAEKDNEMEKVGLRVKQALLRKEEAITELQKQIEKSNFHNSHLEQLLEQQRKDFVQSMTRSSTTKRK